MDHLVEVPVSLAVYQSLVAHSEAEGRSVTELVEEAWRTAEVRRATFARMGEAIDALRKGAVENGTDALSAGEIAEEIELARAERIAVDAQR